MVKYHIEYKDITTNQLILTRQIDENNVNHDTYYVYDFVGRLRYVLPPMVSERFILSGNYAGPMGDYETYRYGYIYRYDERGRLIEKKLPGQGEIYYVYDNDDKLMMTKDWVNKWITYVYDVHGRLLFSCELPDEFTYERAAYYHNNTIRTSKYDPESTLSGWSDIGYTSWRYIHGDKPLTVYYYDDYEFLIISPYAAWLKFDKKAGYGDNYANPKGYVTGKRVYALDGSGDYIATAYYYDSRGRLIQSRSNNFLEAWDETFYEYDFVGNLLKTETRNHQSLSSRLPLSHETITEVYENEYDHAGRLISTDYSLNINGSEKKIRFADYTYDELGKLITKKQHNGVNTVSYKYNIQNWLTEIKDGSYIYNLYYNENDGIYYNNLFNGNINSVKLTGDQSPNLFRYTYDGLNRLTKATARLGGPLDIANLEEFTYDSNGNIITLKRRYGNELINHLNFAYSGNQVIRIDDLVDFNPTYDIKKYMDRYEAWNNYEEFKYDGNGNLYRDRDREIKNIKYNLLNLPDVVEFDNGSKIINRYLVDGSKIETTFTTVLNTVNIPLGVLLPANTNGIDEVIEKIYYYGNKEYADLSIIGEIKKKITRISNAEGYFSNNNFYYYRRDHLGSNREVSKVTGNTFTSVQQTAYYPSGLPYPGWEGGNEQPYKFQDKEFIEMHGYDMYDFHARGYYPAIMRFTSPDPHAESYYHISTYAYCFNNPIRYIDPTGMDPIYGKSFLGKSKLIGDDGNDNGKSYLVKGNIKKDVKKATKAGENYSGALEEGKNVFNIPTGNLMDDVVSSVEKTKISKVEQGAHAYKGDENATHWDPGSPSKEVKDLSGNNVAVSYSIKAFVVDGKNVLPADASKLQLVWHIHSNVYVSGQAMGYSTPSPKDFILQQTLENRGFTGNSFVIGLRNNRVTFYNANKALITVKYSDFLKMGGK